MGITQILTQNFLFLSLLKARSEEQEFLVAYIRGFLTLSSLQAHQYSSYTLEALVIERQMRCLTSKEIRQLPPLISALKVI